MLTEIQRETLFYIDDCINSNGFPPTLREVAAHYGTTVKAIHDRFIALKKKDYLTWKERRPGTLRILKYPDNKIRV